MRFRIVLISLLVLLAGCSELSFHSGGGKHDLVFDDLAESWDEGIPLGNGMLGALVWRKEGKLRISLDRADLWDLRPMINLDFNEISYQWVYDNWINDTYEVVQQRMDVPYEKKAAPTKIPAGALEFDISSLGKVTNVRLNIDEAVCVITWESGARFSLFIDAVGSAGCFKFENAGGEIPVELVAPAYNEDTTTGEVNIPAEVNLTTLGYKKGESAKHPESCSFRQQGWGGFEYHIETAWKRRRKTTEGAWSISASFPGWEKGADAALQVAVALKRGFAESFKGHVKWWDGFWNRSSLSVPDELLEKQWYLEMYKFGSAARNNTPPISLQAVWTADNGRIPPWKGDFHHDLNTQLSYWPAYSSNHTDLEEGFINWMWKYKPVFEKYTKDYFGVEGLNVPGVTTLTGEPMGGWIQYSLGPTVSAWLAHHFYMHWRYTMDEEFLRERAYPWIAEVAAFISNLSVTGEDGQRRLPLSSSPEIHDNSKQAWFGRTTNFDLALIRWTLSKAGELALYLDKSAEADEWFSRLQEWPEFAFDEETGLMFAPDSPYAVSHRHFSHLMAWHPLGLIDFSQGADDIKIIEKTLKNLEAKGSDYWTGYSFSWLGSLYARARKGEKAAEALRIFARAFCLPNSFHVNGDQTGEGFSKYTYRPFTLEGNFAFAAGLQEMLIQSHNRKIMIFPAIPDDWQDAAFENLRTDGAFLISASRAGGKTKEVKIISLMGGPCRIRNPFNGSVKVSGVIINPSPSGFIEFATTPGEVIVLTPGK